MSGARLTVTEITDALERIGHLEDDWDDNGAPPIRDEIVNSAHGMLRQLCDGRGFDSPSRIVASPAGSIMIEWQWLETPNRMLEIEIEEPYVAEWMERREDGTYRHWTERFAALDGEREESPRGD